MPRLPRGKGIAAAGELQLTRAQVVQQRLDLGHGILCRRLRSPGLEFLLVGRELSALSGQGGALPLQLVHRLRRPRAVALQGQPVVREPLPGARQLGTLRRRSGAGLLEHLLPRLIQRRPLGRQLLVQAGQVGPFHRAVRRQLARGLALLLLQRRPLRRQLGAGTLELGTAALDCGTVCRDRGPGGGDRPVRLHPAQLALQLADLAAQLVRLAGVRHRLFAQAVELARHVGRDHVGQTCGIEPVARRYQLSATTWSWGTPSPCSASWPRLICAGP